MCQYIKNSTDKFLLSVPLNIQHSMGVWYLRKNGTITTPLSFVFLFGEKPSWARNSVYLEKFTTEDIV